ncbi:hypothetical protein KIN20_015231 [Parelaphostrongylus tenuis]|uniref:Uncharacterized protein n=1 Tax=Parelaphostrongylus tenuis TaxID=148309 RepID=A0AAD5QPT5_PARTN|nr:hypothetical protein KIN20_015231 [Parelaphostrongylus tenuis]
MAKRTVSAKTLPMFIKEAKSQALAEARREMFQNCCGKRILGTNRGQEKKSGERLDLAQAEKAIWRIWELIQPGEMPLELSNRVPLPP